MKPLGLESKGQSSLTPSHHPAELILSVSGWTTPAAQLPMLRGCVLGISRGGHPHSAQPPGGFGPLPTLWP